MLIVVKKYKKEQKYTIKAKLTTLGGNLINFYGLIMRNI